MNFLEQLAAEWYEYSGYFVRTNVHASKLPGGGYKNEIDVLAYKPREHELIHIETSGGTESWAQINQNIIKKFDLQLNTYEELIDADILKINRIFIAGWSKTIDPERVLENSIEMISIPQFLNRIIQEIHKKDFIVASVSESYPLLRTIQMMDRFQDLSLK